MTDFVIIEALSRLYGTGKKAKLLMEDAGIELANVMEPFGDRTPFEYWRYIFGEINNGGLLQDGKEKLTALARKNYPYNPIFAHRASSKTTPLQGNGSSIEGQKKDLFISYNSKDRPKVGAINEALLGLGISTWFDETEMVGGSPVLQGMENGLKGVKAFCIFVGPSGLGAWQRQELNVAMQLKTAGQLSIIPVQLAGAKPDDLSLFITQYVVIRGDTVADNDLAHMIQGAYRQINSKQ